MVISRADALARRSFAFPMDRRKLLGKAPCSPTFAAEPFRQGRNPVARVRNDMFVSFWRPWVTVRDAIGDLPHPGKAAGPIPNHRLQLGARPYHGHTGSPWDLPAKALKAGDHGVPGGENMLANNDGSVRYFTVREVPASRASLIRSCLMDLGRKACARSVTPSR